MDFDDDDVDIGDLMPEENAKRIRGQLVQLLQSIAMPLTAASMVAAMLGDEKLQEQLSLMSQEITEELERLREEGYIIEEDGGGDSGDDDFVSDLMQP